MASARITSIIAGKNKIHHSPDSRNFCPERISVPSEGCVTGRPTPRKESVASSMTASARLIVAITSTGPITLGRTCRAMMPKPETPISRAAWTYSLLRSTRVEARTVRAYCAQLDRPIATMITITAVVSYCCGGISPRATPKISSAIRMAGKESWMSATRMMTISILPPR